MPLFPMNVASGLVQFAATVSACAILGRIAAESARPQRRAVLININCRALCGVSPNTTNRYPIFFQANML